MRNRHSKYTDTDIGKQLILSDSLLLLIHILLFTVFSANTVEDSYSYLISWLLQ